MANFPGNFGLGALEKTWERECRLAQEIAWEGTEIVGYYGLPYPQLTRAHTVLAGKNRPQLCCDCSTWGLCHVIAAAPGCELFLLRQNSLTSSLPDLKKFKDEP